MSSENLSEEIAMLRAALQDAELRLEKKERDAQEVLHHDSERLFFAAFDESPEPMGLTRMRDGLIVDVNQEWLLLTRYSRDEVIGRTTTELNHWASEAERQAVMTALSDKGRLRERDVTLVMKGGAHRLTSMSSSLLNVLGEPHVLTHIKDITAQRMASEALRAGELALAQANEKLNEQVRLYELTENLAQVGHGMAAADGKSFTWSKGLHAIAGTSPGQLMTREQVLSRINEDDLDLYLQARRKMDGRTVEFRLWHEDGSLRWMRSRMHRQLSSNGETVEFDLVQDITAEKAVTKTLQEKLDFIERVTSRIPDAVLQYQLGPDGKFCFPFISEGLRTLLQIAPEDAQRNPLLMFDSIHPDDAREIFKLMKSEFRVGGTWAREYRVRLADGSIRWVQGNSSTYSEDDGTLVSYGSITDINSLKEAEMRAQLSEARFRSLTDLSSDWYWEIDSEFRFTRIDGFDRIQAKVLLSGTIGKTRWELGALNLNETEWRSHRAVLQAHQQFKDFEIQRAASDGQTYWISISGLPMFGVSGEFLGYRGIGRDISARKRIENQTLRLAFYDTLTDLPNRRLLMDRLSLGLVSSARSQRHGALLFIDLDNFKDLNDSLGHDVGDHLLRLVAGRLVTCVREGDTAARFGGDEFVVMLENLSNVADEAASQAELVAEKILGRLNAPYDLQGRPHNSTPSIGITLFCGNQVGSDELFKRADVAMYQAKAAGRNTLRFFDPQMQAAVMERAALDADLRQGLKRGELLLYYQPVVDITGSTIGVEALLRWRHPQRGLVPPGEFIELAEQTGLILPIGQWVLETACQQLVAWSHDTNTRDLTMAVNVSARQFRQPDFVDQVLAVLASCGANPQRLKLELTESILLSDVEDAISKMSLLGEKGVSFALDDFGTGYSSLSYLKRLPLDQLKIDQSFVRDVLTDPNDAAIVRTILALARSMDLVAVAEGVESEGQRQFLLESGCTIFQGYLFGKPVPLDQLSLSA